MSNIKRITINGNILKAVVVEPLEEQKEEEPLPSPQWRQDSIEDAPPAARDNPQPFALRP
jgi:hypothetical protein